MGSKRDRAVRRGVSLAAALCLMTATAPSAGSAQDLADLDYEHLSFRGVGFDVGYLFPTRVDRTPAFGMRFDMGYAGPGLRIMPNIGYWSSPLEDGEVAGLENRISELIVDQNGPPAPALDLGTIEWRDIAVGVDAHVVWDTFLGLLTYGGFGVTAHFLDGSGNAIDDTLIDDLLDSVTAGLNLHFGMEYPFTPNFRAYTEGKYEVLSDLQYFQVKVGWQLMWGPSAPGEER